MSGIVYKELISLASAWSPPPSIAAIPLADLAQYLFDEYKLSLKDNNDDDEISFPQDAVGQKILVRGLLTIRPPTPPLPQSIIDAVHLHLINESKARLSIGLTDIQTIKSEMTTPLDVSDRVSVWQGDITALSVDAIVNAANDRLLGCFQPSHKCIDNIIHAAAGPLVRMDCAKIVQNQGHLEPTGECKITRAYCLPSRFILHAVGPIVRGGIITAESCRQLASCYTSCLTTAMQCPVPITTVAFCCISTGLFGFPQDAACQLAVASVREFLHHHPNSFERVIFNVFKDEDYHLYKTYLSDDSVNRPLDVVVGDLTVRQTPFSDQSLISNSRALMFSKARGWLNDADCILIAAGAGMSAAAGLDYTDTVMFKDKFPAMAARGFTCFYDFIGYRGWSDALKWGYLSMFVKLVRYEWPTDSPIYTILLSYIKTRDYFINTSNADGLFYRCGYDANRIYTPQGAYSLMQCMKPCRQDAYWDTLPVIERMLPAIDKSTNLLTDEKLIPRCPHCGTKDVFLNVRAANWFLETPREESRLRFESWMSKAMHKRLVIVEIGVGFNTPSVIRWPCEDMTRRNPQAHLIRINLGDADVPNDIASRCLSAQMVADEAVAALFT